MLMSVEIDEKFYLFLSDFQSQWNETKYCDTEHSLRESGLYWITWGTEVNQVDGK